MKKAIVSTQYKILEGIFDVGDKVNIEIIRESEDITYTKMEYFDKTDSRGNTYKTSRIVPDITVPKGSYKGFRIKSKNGHYYDDGCFHIFLGYKPLSEIFTLEN